MVNISTKVGKGQPNYNTADNTAVQNLLNKFIQPNCLVGIAQLVPDGDIGAKTVAAIAKFQREILGFKNPDCYVSPNGQTLTALNGPVKPPFKPSPDNGAPKNAFTDAELTNEWALNCVSYKKYSLTLELVNIYTDRAHRLLYAGVGSDTIQQASAWLKGQYFHKFTTRIPTNFANFDGNIAIITPEPGLASITHIMRIGSFTTLYLPQAPGDPFGQWDLYGACKVIYGNGERTKPLMYAPYYPNSPNNPGKGAATQTN